MDAIEYRRLEELMSQYPYERCRQIASMILDAANVPDVDHICAAGILNALEAAEHVQDLTILEVSEWQLRAAAAVDSERLWGRYGEE
jgi:hypothetical protein